MVEQESLLGLGRVVVETPGTLALADGVPRPDRMRVHPVHQADLALHPPEMRGDPDPVVVHDTDPRAEIAVDVEPVLRRDLPQPRVLRAPGMVDRKSTRLNSSHSGESRMP